MRQDDGKDDEEESRRAVLRREPRVPRQAAEDRAPHGRVPGDEQDSSLAEEKGREEDDEEDEEIIQKEVREKALVPGRRSQKQGHLVPEEIIRRERWKREREKREHEEHAEEEAQIQLVEGEMVMEEGERIELLLPRLDILP